MFLEQREYLQMTRGMECMEPKIFTKKRGKLANEKGHGTHGTFSR